MFVRLENCLRKQEVDSIWVGERVVEKRFLHKSLKSRPIDVRRHSSTRGWASVGWLFVPALWAEPYMRKHTTLVRLGCRHKSVALWAVLINYIQLSK